MDYVTSVGRYFLMIWDCFKNPVKGKVLGELVLRDIDILIYKSLKIIIFISFSMGVVISIQTALNLENPLIPKYLIGFTARQSIILEFAPTLLSVIMAGKIGSYITSSIGSMKVSEQIDVLEVMGINPLNYLVLPKIIALLLYPFTIIIAITSGIFGGWVAAIYGQYCSPEDFMRGVLINFEPIHIYYSITKAFVFGIILATIPAYHGYYMKGGALEVGKATTKAFIWTSASIISMNYILTQLILG